jgi:D-alanyl-D-alanine carboxypeptidase/D-alanyl-D-alanine-endopeptidase (penicillin-binding protein 4)
MDFIKNFKINRGLKPLVLKSLIVISLIATLPAQAQSDRLCPAQLQQEVEKIAKSPKLQPSRVGVFVQTNESNPTTLANLDGDRYFIPASNIKLFTTAITLKILGADYRFTTRLMSQNLPNAKGELESGLWLVADGDPSFSSATGLKSLVTQLTNKGVKRINGGLWTLTSHRGAEISGSWEWQDLQEYYAAIASPFTIDENALNWSIQPSEVGKPAIFKWEDPLLAKDWRVENQSVTVPANSQHTLQVLRPYGQKLLIISGQVPEKSEIELGGVAIPNPEAHFLDLLRQELTAQGIVISTNTSTRVIPVHDLAIAYSPPLSQLVTTTNKDSNNLYAELLLRSLGSPIDAITPNDRAAAGMITINKYLQAKNISMSSVSLADGSGLSRRNIATPRAIVQLLQSVASDRSINHDFRKSLPIAGVDGTLTNRFKNTAAQGLLQAKTGTLTGAIALSGYVKPKNYSEVVFSIVINNSILPTRELQQYIDAIALLLNRLESCP